MSAAARNRSLATCRRAVKLHHTTPSCAPSLPRPQCCLVACSHQSSDAADPKEGDRDEQAHARCGDDTALLNASDDGAVAGVAAPEAAPLVHELGQERGRRAVKCAAGLLWRRGYSVISRCALAAAAAAAAQACASGDTAATMSNAGAAACSGEEANGPREGDSSAAAELPAVLTLLCMSSSAAGKRACATSAASCGCDPGAGCPRSASTRRASCQVLRDVDSHAAQRPAPKRLARMNAADPAVG